MIGTHGDFEGIADLCDKDGAEFNVLKHFIPGKIGLLPTFNYNTRFICCVDEDGGLPRNDLACKVLDFLEFDVSKGVFGTIVILGSGFWGLSTPQMQSIIEVCKAFKEKFDPQEIGAEHLTTLFGKIGADHLVDISPHSEEEEEEGPADVEEFFNQAIRDPSNQAPVSVPEEFSPCSNSAPLPKIRMPDRSNVEEPPRKKPRLI
jgi:hypothetical protein